MKKIFAVVFVLVVAVLIYAGVSPYVATYKLHQAFKAGDSETVNEHIDYPALKANIKSQMLVALKQSMGGASDGSTPEIPDAFIEQMINPAIDALSPEVVARMVESQFMVGQAATTPLGTLEENKSADHSNYKDVFNKIRYTGLNTVSVVHTDEKTQQRIEADLERRGLGHWQVVKIGLNVGPVGP